MQNASVLFFLFLTYLAHLLTKIDYLLLDTIARFRCPKIVVELLDKWMALI